MPGITELLRKLPSMKDHFIIYPTDAERRAYLKGLLNDKYVNTEYCIIITIFYLTICKAEVTKKVLDEYLGGKIGLIEFEIRRVIAAGHVKEDPGTHLLTLVP